MIGDRMFAVGKYVHYSFDTYLANPICACPTLTAAGVPLKRAGGAALEAYVLKHDFHVDAAWVTIGRYDDDPGPGPLNETQAKRRWLAAIESVRGESYLPSTVKAEAIRFGEHVARELGWL